MPLPSGAPFAGYTLVRLLSSGESAESYLAERPGEPGSVVLTVLIDQPAADAGIRQRFAARATGAATLRHPHVLRVYDHGDFQGWAWVATDYVDGPTCDRLLGVRYQDGMPGEAVDTIVSAVAGALDYSHANGVVHGDVKPANIVLTPSDADGTRGILLDFFGSAYVDPADDDAGDADQPALAATALHLLSGFAPSAHHRLGAELAPAQATLARALAEEPADRFPTCAAFADALGAALPKAEPMPEPEPEPTHDAPAPPAKNATNAKKKRVRVATVVPALLAVLVLAGASAFLFRDRLGLEWFRTKPTPTTSTQAAPITSAVPLPPAAPACGDGPQLLASMSLRDKLAQLLMVGVTGAADARKVVADHHVGGIFIGSWTDLSMLSDGTLPALDNAGAPLPLAVSVDEEGGRVQRLKSIIGSQESARVLRQTLSLQEVHDIAFERGQKMKALGITIDFAPDVDVTDEPDDEVIGDRSFGSDAATVTEYAGEYAKGLREAGLLPVLKHFPGHGHGSGDSHTGGVSTPPLSELAGVDLVPYQTLTTQPPVAVMVGHLDVPGLTDQYPASLSPQAYHLLRSGDYGGPPFDGPIFTDDLSSMRAISDRFGVAEAALRALQAGADVALWVTTDEVPAVLDRLESAVHSGDLNPEQVDASVLRVAGFKGKNPHCGG